MPKLSIIVPIYNSEPYIRKCLDNIIDQGFSDFECILVNDGSKDNSINICNEYVEKDSRFKLVNKENGGASSARNTGIEQAIGDFIAFVDSDDILVNDIYTKAFEIIRTESADMVCFNMVKLEGDKQIPIPFKNVSLIDNFINYDVYMHSVCNKVFNTEVIKKNSIRFDESIRTCEDFLFVFTTIANARKVVYMDETGYVYRANNTSLTNRIKDLEMIEDQKNVYFRLKEYCENRNIEEKYKELIRYRKMCWAVLYLLMITSFDPDQYRVIAGDSDYYCYGNRKSIRMISYYSSKGFDLPAKGYILAKKILNRRR